MKIRQELFNNNFNTFDVNCFVLGDLLYLGKVKKYIGLAGGGARVLVKGSEKKLAGLNKVHQENFGDCFEFGEKALVLDFALNYCFQLFMLLLVQLHLLRSTRRHQW